MANDLSNAIDTILAERALPVLREQSLLPRLCNRDIANVTGRKGQAVDVTVAAAGTVRDVTPGPAVVNQDKTPTKKTVNLNYWREATHHVTDKEFEEVMEGYMTAQMEEDLRSLINDLDLKMIQELYQKAYNVAGTAGTTPFASDLAAFKGARVHLNESAAPQMSRYVLLNPDAEGNALVLGQFLKADERGDQGGIINGQIGRKLGSDWFMDQNIPTHTTGAAGTPLVNGASQTGTTLIVDGFTTKPSVGDKYTVAGDTQEYTVLASTTLSGTESTLTISPAIVTAAADNAALTFVASYVPNLHFHRDALAFASRVLERSRREVPGAAVFRSIVDPISGLVVRLEISRQWRQTTVAWDILAGYTTVYPQLAAVILG